MRSVELTDQISLVLRRELDEMGRQTTLYGAGGLLRRIVYDEVGRPIRVTDSQERTTELRYNANNDLVERLLPGNVRERWQYDAVGRLIAHENAAGVMRLEYDTEDHLLAVVNRAGERLTRRYDADGRVVAQTNFDGRTERYESNLRGLRTRRVIFDGRVVDARYDKAGYLVGRTGSDGLEEEFAYDENARLILARNADATVEFERDELGRVIAEVQNGRRVEYEYDADNNCVTRRLGGVESGGLGMRYDLRNRLVALEDRAGVCQELTWDTTDQLRERRFPSGMVERFDYDPARRLRQQEVESASRRVVVRRRYEYDDADNVIACEELGADRVELRYDAIDRLTEVRRRGVIAESYDYDPIGTVMRTHRGPRATKPGGRTITDGTRGYEYGDDGCDATIDISEGQYVLRYDVDGKLVGVTLPGGAEVRYAYDPLGRRVSKVVDGARVDFLWQSCDLAAELRENESPLVFFQYNQAPLAQWRGGRRHVPVVDQIGLPHAVLDEQGKAVWRASYEAYGLLVREEGTSATPFRFRGQYHDRETGFYYNFHRHYDPSLAGYLAPDPIGLVGGSNFYLYPRNPLLWDDPFGLTCSTKHSGQMGEQAMDAHYAALGYTKLGSHDAPHGGGPGRPQGIDGVYHNPNGSPPYIIAEAKYGSAGLGQTVHSGEQMSNQWINSPIGGTGPGRLEQAVGPAHAAAIQNSATQNPGSVKREVFNLPSPGTPGTGSVTASKNYNPASNSGTF
jgi:RHS repeat-associated protein